MDGGLRLVIADADSNYRNMLCEAAAEAGDIDIVGCAGSGAELLRLLGNSRPDVLLLDLILPDGDGLYVMDKVRSAMSPCPRFVVNTCFVSCHTGSECARLGVSSLILKPNSPQLLFDHVRSAYEFAPHSAPAPAVHTASGHSFYREATELLIELGFSARYRGYAYLREALVMTCGGHDPRGELTTVIYPEIARQYGTSWKNVERAVRIACDSSWRRGGAESLARLPGFRERGKMTPSLFIALLTDYLCGLAGGGLKCL